VLLLIFLIVIKEKQKSAKGRGYLSLTKTPVIWLDLYLKLSQKKLKKISARV